MNGKWLRLCAALGLLATGGVMLDRVPAVGVALLVLGAGIAGQQIVTLWRERSDPYDLKALERVHNAKQEPEKEADPDGLIYCHRCGASMPSNRAICPDCGSPLGH